MPFFLDRHDIRDATAEAIAAAHQQDLSVQHRHTCKALTYWFDEQRGTAFCLIEAPTEAAVRAMHRDSHGLIPTLISEVNPATVTSFLGRVADPDGAVGAPIREAGFRALMYIDLVDSTRMTTELGDARAQAVMARYHAAVRQELLTHEGREVDRAGDGFLTSFASASQAVACAVAVQRSLEGLNTAGALPVPLRARIGLGAGEPLTDGTALFGATVNLTARICAAAAPGQILAARVVRELCAGKSLAFRPHGEIELKGFPEPVELHAVEWSGPA